MTDSTQQLAGKVALVTGASGGLGAHFAAVLAGAGAHVVIAARRTGAVADVAARIRAAGGQCEEAVLDVTSPQSIAAIAHVIARTDILVNNAGITCEKSMLDLTEGDWDSVIETNLKGVFLMAQAVARALRDRKVGGSIINIASIYGFRQAGLVLPYVVSKAGVVQMTKAMALELARYGIGVNAIAPGYFSTEMNAGFFDTEPGKAMQKRIPQRRLGLPHELDGALLLLASDQSSYMTGSVITVDGGHLVSTL